MKKCISYSISLVLLIGAIYSCKKDTLSPIINQDPIVLDEVTLGLFRGLIDNIHVLTSDLNGDLIECIEINDDTLLNFSESIYQQIPAFNITLQTAFYDDYIIDGQIPIRVGLNTYTNIKTDRIRVEGITYNYTLFGQGGDPRVFIDPNISANAVEFISVSSSVHHISHYSESPLKLWLPGQEGDVMVMLKLKNEIQWRFQFFENAQNHSTIQLDIPNMSILPNHIIEIPDGLQLNWGGMFGITSCEPLERFHIRQYTEYSENKATTAFPVEAFDRFYSHMHLTSDEANFQIIQTGDPVMEYNPSPIDFSVMQENINGFWLTPGTDASYYYASWSDAPAGQNLGELTKTFSWTVWGDMANSFKPPTLPECISNTYPWVNTDNLRLKTVAQYEHSNLIDYEAFVRYTLQPQSYDFSCDYHGFEGGGRQEVKTKLFD